MNSVPRFFLLIILVVAFVAVQAAEKGASKLTTPREARETKPPVAILPDPATNRVASTNVLAPTNAALAEVTPAAGTNAVAGTNVAKSAKLPITPSVKPVPGIIRGPYLQSATSNSIVVRWRTDLPGPSVVRYGHNPAKLDRKTNSSGVLAEHLVLISG